MKWIAVGLAVFALLGTATAGEILFANGSRLEGELANEMLMISTGTGLVEVSPDQVAVLTREEIRLKDGRVIRGTLVGGRVKAQTALGEIAIKPGELEAYRAGIPAPETATPATTPAVPAGAAPSAGARPAPRASLPSPTASGMPAPAAGTDVAGSGLPSLATYQAHQEKPASASSGGGAVGTPATEATAPASPAGPTASVRPTGNGTTALPGPLDPGRRLLIVGESVLYRDAFATAARVGRVARGELVAYLDFIDRRLRILNALVFDGGYWIKVRVADGTEGWVPADVVREAR